MTTVSLIHLMQSHMHAPVRYNVRLDGTPTDEPGVTAIVTRERGLGWCLLCDHPNNFGVSVTNGAAKYAEAVCQALECDVSDLVWYELDSVGDFDEMSLLGGSARFGPLLEAGCAPRTMDAFFVRVAKLAPGAPHEAVTAVRAIAHLFQARNG
jgi:hypothetical protein